MENNPDSTSNERPSAPAAEHTTLPLEVLYRDQQCGVQQTVARWIGTQADYESLSAELRQTYMGDQAERFPTVDFAQHSVLLVAMGQKNTGGYGVDLANEQASIRQGLLTITVNWREPQKGMMVIQALTSPCMLLKVPKAEIERIEIKDQRGGIRLSVAAQHEP